VTGPAPDPTDATVADGADAGRPAAVAVVIPAKDEAQNIAATVAAARTIDGVDVVVVVDDGSRDGTAQLAQAAGAEVVRHERNRGKAAAMTSGADYVQRHEVGMPTPRALLFVDADLGDSAAATAALVPPVLSGAADMTIAVLPPQESPGGGHGFVVGLATRGIVRATSWTPTQPLSGMRCLSRPAFEAARPLARGWGVEVGLTIDLLRAGMRVLEVPCELHHRVTGRDLRAQLHRGRQYRDVWLALARRRVDVGRRLRARRRRPAADGLG
jgi:glycosyltransferase involved in cell wall biosynthesis